MTTTPLPPQACQAPIKKGVEKLQAELTKAWRDIETLSVVELAGRNASVAEFCQHWTERATKAEQARADLEAENQRLREALERAELFIDDVRQDLHHERIADWYPEGAHSSAAVMSESMRVIGNRCADFEAEAALESRP